MRDPKRETIDVDNTPSKEHNNWLSELSWRHYHNIVIPDIVNMYWRVYKGMIQDGLDEFERPGGLLRGKGWIMGSHYAYANHRFAQLRKDIDSGRHAPVN
jgi:hypothetical protein